MSVTLNTFTTPLVHHHLSASVFYFKRWFTKEYIGPLLLQFNYFTQNGAGAE